MYLCTLFFNRLYITDYVTNKFMMQLHNLSLKINLSEKMLINNYFD